MNSMLPEGVELAPFIPRACEFKGMDAIIVLTEDVSTVTQWHGLVCIEHQLDGTTLKGFNLVGAKYLRGKWQTKFVPLLLLRAFYFDLKSKQHQSSWKELLKLYFPAARLLARYPTTWLLN